MLPRPLSTSALILQRMESTPEKVWTPSDFADIAKRASVDKALQRLAGDQAVRRLDWGLYSLPRKSRLTGRETTDYRAVIQAVMRSNKSRYVVDGMTAANDLGLTTAVPAKIEVLVDNRIKPINLGKQKISFKSAAPNRLYWADRPAMRVVQALYWLQDKLRDANERTRVAAILRRLLADPEEGHRIRDDLREGLSALPIWMQEFLRDVLVPQTGRKRK